MLKGFIKKLLSTTEEELETIATLESQGKFNDHTSEGGFTSYEKVDENYNFYQKNKFKHFFLEKAFVRPFINTANRVLQTEVIGIENLKGVNGAIICCNHVNRLDCCALFKAIPFKKLYVTAAEFNNYEGFLGKAMRVGGMLPFSSNITAMKNLENTITDLLQKGNKIVFFAEGSEWWCYKKPRPLLNGAFKIAVKNNVPVLPMFITFVDTEESKNSPLGLPKFVLNILPPVYPNGNKTKTENVETLKNETSKSWQDCYDKAYKNL